MTRRNLLQAAAAPAILRAARRPGDKPNLLFLWTDQQRADTMAAYGNHTYKVPALNRLASESVVFDRAYVAQPVCTPSRSCIMTGLWPHQSGCVNNNIALRPDVKTVPELLADSGYRTGYMGKWHLGDEIFAQRGFQEWKAIEDGIYQSYYSEGRDKNKRSAYHDHLLSLGYQPDDPKRQNSFSRMFAAKLPAEHSKPAFLAAEASKFILKNRREPWMLYVNSLEPHTPFFSAFDDLHSEEEAPLPPNYPGVPTGPEPEWYKTLRARQTRPKSEGFDLSNREGFVRLNRNYAGLCSLVDLMVHRILWALEASGQAENTIVVFTSDHGEMRGSHSMITKSIMYEEAIRVPYLLRVPFRQQKPMRVTAPVSHIDTVPTMLQLLGMKDVAGFAGRSLTGHLTGDRKPDDVFLQWNNGGKNAGPNGRTVITPAGEKLVLHDTDVSLLFDRRRDPLEMNNLIQRPEAKATRDALTRKVLAWQKQTKDNLEVPA